MFDTRPLNKVRTNRIQDGLSQGYAALIELVEARWQTVGQTQAVRVVIDGTHGADFGMVAEKLASHFEERGCAVRQFKTSDYLKSGAALRELFKENITDNRAFGFVTSGTLADYFVANAQDKFYDHYLSGAYLLAPSEEAASPIAPGLTLVYGPGAFWLSNLTSGEADARYDLKLFVDVSREYQELGHKADLLNWGFEYNLDGVEKYKIAYFVEWPILESYRANHLTHFDYYVDLNQPTTPVVTTVKDLLEMITEVTRFPLRVKPFFMSGVWGGQYLKKLAGLPDEMVNCAWDFEPIAPENSILFEYEQAVIEVPFLLVMRFAHLAVMGERNVGLFGDYFPIRFDYLDTVGGDNLSCQVHPHQEYIRSQFGDFLEQQESYYVMHNEPDSKVYLGLTPGCERSAFYEAVSTSQATGEPITFTDYVQGWDSKQGDLFLIPPGTVHGSGKGNLVLEISSTTWWFTFKIYDYVRKDLDGKPRPINLEYAFDNINFERKTEWVGSNLIGQPQLLQRQNDNAEYGLGQRPDLLFYVHRLHITNEWLDDTAGEFVLLNLVEGERVRLVWAEDERVYFEYTYAESCIVPAAFGRFKIINLGEQPCKLIKAGVSPDWKVDLFH